MHRVGATRIYAPLRVMYSLINMHSEQPKEKVLCVYCTHMVDADEIGAHEELCRMRF